MAVVTRRRQHGAVAAVRRDLLRLPEELRDGVEAACAKELARSIDQGLLIAQSTRELTRLMVQLRARARTVQDERGAADASATVKESPVADLAAHIASRRRAASG